MQRDLRDAHRPPHHTGLLHTAGPLNSLRSAQPGAQLTASFSTSTLAVVSFPFAWLVDPRLEWSTSSERR